MAEDKSVREAFAEGFAGVSREELEQLSDVELAQFQNGWNPEATRHILASREWDRRLAMRQLQEQFRLDERLAEANRWWSIWVAIIGVLATLAGAVIGAVLQARLSPPTAPLAPNPQSEPAAQKLPPPATTPTLSASSATPAPRASQAKPTQ
jgi:hypothetical protein